MRFVMRIAKFDGTAEGKSSLIRETMFSLVGGKGV
jgi:hypothetical protein